MLCPLGSHEFWGWIAQLEKRDDGAYHAYGSAESGDCTTPGGGDLSLCPGTDGAPYSSGRYRVKITFWSFPSGITDIGYTPSADIK